MRTIKAKIRAARTTSGRWQYWQRFRFWAFSETTGIRPSQLLNLTPSVYRLTSRSILVQYTLFSFNRFAKDDFYFNRLWDKIDAPAELTSMIRFRHRYGTLSFQKVTRNKRYKSGSSEVELLPPDFIWSDR